MNKTFIFKELDREGLETLEAIAAADAFNAWMYAVTSQHLSGNILEIGSGIGNISTFFLRDARSLMLSDIRENYCGYLHTHFKRYKTCLGVRQIDLIHPNFEVEYADLLESFEGVFALNVIEHIEDDALALANCYKLLKKGGHLVILVPAYQWLYNEFDRNLAHFRRYTEGGLRERFLAQNFEVLHSQYFNFAAIGGWWFSGNILRKKVIPKGQMKIYNFFVPVFKVVDKILGNRIGISTIVVGRK